MNVTCDHCETVYRVDPAKVPAGGVSARCSNCSGVFRVERDPAPGAGAVAPLAGADQRQASQAQQPEPPESRESLDDGAERPGGSGSQAAAAEPSQDEEPPLPQLTAPAAASTPPATSAPARSEGAKGRAAAPEAKPYSPFGSADPRARARRLARALVSDIVVYHPERRERSRSNGTLRQEFRDEIRKSWEEYVGQVGNDIARSTPYFREALNELLAGGDRVF